MFDVYIGNKSGEEIFFTKPMVKDKLGVRPLYPNEARLKDISYQCDFKANILVVITDYSHSKGDSTPDVQERFFPDVYLGSIPIMLHSCMCILNNQTEDVLREMGECPFDKGGYFIIDGKEKVLISQEKGTLNRLMVSKAKEKDAVHYNYEATIKCIEEDGLFPKEVSLKTYSSDYMKTSVPIAKELGDTTLVSRYTDAITVRFREIESDIPVFIIFRILGILSDKEIVHYIAGNNKQIQEFLRPSIVHGSVAVTQEESVNFVLNRLIDKTTDYVYYLMIENFLPNIVGSFRKKAVFLGYLCRKLILTQLGVIDETNMDDFKYKRVLTPGLLCSNLFRDAYSVLRRGIIYNLENQYTTNIVLAKSKITTETVITSLINPGNLYLIFDSSRITDGFTKSLKGKWQNSTTLNLAQMQSNKQINSIIQPQEGVSQDLNRLSYIASVSHIRRLNTPLDRSVKLVSPHKIHGSTYGYTCPIESPDGGNIGLIKHFTIISKVTLKTDVDEIKKCIVDLGVTSVEENLYTSDFLDIEKNLTKVFINYNLEGYCDVDKQYHIYNRLKLYKRVGIINIFTSISWNMFDKEIHVLTEEGRLTRPLYVIDKIEQLKKATNQLDWLDLVKGSVISNEEYSIYDSTYHRDLALKITDEQLMEHAGIIEYVDIEESNDIMICPKRSLLTAENITNYTHCEIHPTTMFSMYTNIIPYVDHNPYPRNAFSGQQGKQAIGVYATNFKNRIDTASYILHYPQKHLVNTRYSKYTRLAELPNGQNLMVAIMTYTGYNQEDSIILNKASIERGMFNITSYKSVVSEEEASIVNDVSTKFANSKESQKSGVNIKVKPAFWGENTIDENGFPRENTYIHDGEPYLGKIRIDKKNTQVDTDIINDFLDIDQHKNSTEYTDKTLVGNKLIYGIIDKVFVYEKPAKNSVDNLRKVKIRIRKFRKPTLGDKMASLHGQKGVCGIILQEDDMPFTSEGLHPDIIINPHAIPSRMTIGHLIECVSAKFACMEGTTIDATAFELHNLEQIYDTLPKYNLQRHGNEILYNGCTGEQINTEIFYGPTYYYRLKHMVEDKINYRSVGPKEAITRQPTKGRSSGGGLKIGNMEMNALISHGIANFIKETIAERSDKLLTSIDRETGTMSFPNARLKTLLSSYGYENNDHALIEIPHSMKILIQELEAVGLGVKLKTKSTGDGDEYLDISAFSPEFYEFDDYTNNQQQGNADDNEEEDEDEDDEEDEENEEEDDEENEEENDDENGKDGEEEPNEKNEDRNEDGDE
jgi:DNA-directed RNA polymerase II subunit RPB2